MVNTNRKWWRWRVTLPHETACKAGAFLVGHIPEHAALVLPQAWVVLETSLCRLARGITADQMVRPAGYAPASQRWRRRILAIGPWPLESPADGRKSHVLRRRHADPQVHRSPQDFTIKNEHHYELLFLVPAGISRRMFRCFRHTSPATLYLYFHIELSLSLL